MPFHLEFFNFLLMIEKMIIKKTISESLEQIKAVITGNFTVFTISKLKNKNKWIKLPTQNARKRTLTKKTWWCCTRIGIISMTWKYSYNVFKIYFLALTLKGPINDGIPVGTSTTSAQILVSEYHFSLKLTRIPWINSWFQV